MPDSTPAPRLAETRLTEHRVGREELVDGVLLHAYRDTVRLPDGSESVREWIQHPGASAVVPLFEDGSTLLLRQFRYATGRVYLEVPAGKLDEGESPEETARRETKEEAGLEIGKLTMLASLDPCIGYSDEVIHFFLAEDIEEVDTGTDADEFVEPVRMPFDEAVRMAQAGELRDMKTTAAVLMAAAHVRSRG